jgi:hypothetical protein
MRKPLSKRTRFEVFKRDGFRCMYCGQRPPEVVLVIDHIVPVVQGGTDEPTNLTTACYTCNAGKSGIPLDRVSPIIDELALAEALQEVAERRMALEGFYAEQSAYQQDLNNLVDQVEELWAQLVGRVEDPKWVQIALTCFERRSLVNFARRGLSLREFEHAIHLVGESWKNGPRSADALWRHFCKLCWDAIRASGVDW